MKDFLRYLKDEEGQTTTEYVLLIAIAGAVIMKVSKPLQSQLEKLVNDVFNKVGSQLGQ